VVVEFVCIFPRSVCACIGLFSEFAGLFSKCIGIFSEGLGFCYEYIGRFLVYVGLFWKVALLRLILIRGTHIKHLCAIAHMCDISHTCDMAHICAIAHMCDIQSITERVDSILRLFMEKFDLVPGVSRFSWD